MRSGIEPVSQRARSRLPDLKPWFAEVDNRTRLRKRAERQFLGVVGAVTALACGQVTEPVPSATSLSLSTASLTLPAGTVERVTVSVVAPTAGLRLNFHGLPTGVIGSLSPAFLGSGKTASTLTLDASPAATPGEVTLTIEAWRDIPGGALLATAKLRVQITAPTKSECPGYAIPTDCPPFPTGGNNVISGFVMERTKTGTRPAAGVSIWAWVRYANGNGYRAGRLQSDTAGRYLFPLLPNALVVLQTYGGGYDQPCASIVELSTSSLTVDLEVVAQGEPIFETAPAQPALTGVVYETTAEGRRPLSGARVYFEFLNDEIAATTTTDALGRYSLCRLPTSPAWVTPFKTGYITTGRSVSVSGLIEMDMEMKRQ
ncbi:MAG: carboxypeptidase-like regulatory domain-containing protein [Gemmatimonadaceae bacterium]